MANQFTEIAERKANALADALRQCGIACEVDTDCGAYYSTVTLWEHEDGDGNPWTFFFSHATGELLTDEQV
jgi:hypothetical protein